MSDVSYRFLTTDDVDIFQRMRLRAIKDDPEAFLESYEEIAEKPTWYFKRYFDNGWIAGVFMDGHLKGICGLYRHKGVLIAHKGTVWGVFVATEARGHGFGKQMITLLCNKAKEAGIEQVLLSTNVENTVTVGLYESLGFVAYGVEKHMIKIEDRYIDEVMMIKFLDSHAL